LIGKELALLHDRDALNESDEAEVTSQDEENGTISAEPHTEEAHVEQPTNHNYWNEQESSRCLTKEAQEIAMEEDTATVYLAVANKSKYKLAVVGESRGWGNPKGSFEIISESTPECSLAIFKGTIPIPFYTPSAFKFVQLSNKIKYEGDGRKDDRRDELLPNSTHFFIFKERPKQVTKKVKQLIQRGPIYREYEIRLIIIKFLNIAFNLASLEKEKSDWDTAFDVLKDCLEKIQVLGKRNELHDCLRQFITDSLEWDNPARLALDNLLLMILSANLTQIALPGQLIDNLLIQGSAFSLYLYDFPKLKRNEDIYAKVLESLISFQSSPNAADYYWIPFLFNRQNQLTSYANLNEVQNALIKAIVVNPDPFLFKQYTAARVGTFLLYSRDIDDIYSRFEPLINKPKNLHHKRTIENAFLISLMKSKRNADDWKKILCSRFLEKINQGELDNNPDINPEIYQKSESGYISLKIFFESLFSQELPLLVELACSTPAHLLGSVKPVVEFCAQTKIEELFKNFKQVDYERFSMLESTKLDNFPDTKKKIEDKCICISNDYARKGLFQNIPSLKFILQSLADMGNVPFLEQPSYVDLQRAMQILPLNFLKNLHIVILGKSPDLGDLKQYRNGKTRDVVDKIKRHIELIKKMIVNVRNYSVPLSQAASLQDPRVANYLIHFGLEEKVLMDIRIQIETLRSRSKLYRDLFNTFGWYSSFLIYKLA